MKRNEGVGHGKGWREEREKRNDGIIFQLKINWYRKTSEKNFFLKGLYNILNTKSAHKYLWNLREYIHFFINAHDNWLRFSAHILSASSRIGSICSTNKHDSLYSGFYLLLCKTTFFYICLFVSLSSRHTKLVSLLKMFC